MFIVLPFWWTPFPWPLPLLVNIGKTEFSGVTGGTVNVGASFSCQSGSGGGGPSISNTMASVQGECPLVWIGYGIVLDGQRQARSNQTGGGQAGGGGTGGARGAVDPPVRSGAIRYVTTGRPPTAPSNRSQILAGSPSGVTMIG